MSEITLREALAQASQAEAVELLHQTLRQSVRLALFDAMEEEVNSLCGATTVQIWPRAQAAMRPSATFNVALAAL